MWSKELINKMFPDGTVPFAPTPAADLEYSSIDKVTTHEHRMARNMMIEQREITWNSDGSIERMTTYDVYSAPPVNGMHHALSVYGAKMVQNWKWFRAQENEEIKEINDAGFNYTGL